MSGRDRPGPTSPSALVPIRGVTTALRLPACGRRSGEPSFAGVRQGCGTGCSLRSGLTTKVHALVDANGLPITFKLIEGQAHNGRSATDMLDTVGEGDVLLADRAYQNDELRHMPPNAVPGPMSGRCPTAKTSPRSVASSSDTATSSNASSASSSPAALSPRAMKSTPKTTSRSSNSPQQKSECSL